MPPTAETILIVDDSNGTRKLLSVMLGGRGYQIVEAYNGRTGIQMARQELPDIILLDVSMPDIDGLEVAQQLQEEETTSDIPIIFISALDNIDYKVKGFQIGGVDYISRPFDLAEVIVRIQNQLRIQRQRKQIEELLNKERATFEQLSDMKDRLLATTSHDLKNPLNNIQAAAHLLTLHLQSDDETTIKYLDIITRNTTRMSQLVVDLLDIARLETGLALNLQETEVNTYFGNLVNDFCFEAENKGINLHFVPTAEADYCFLDPSQIERVIQNLLSNAIKYTPTNGTVSLILQADPEHLYVSVRDNGIGIPSEDIPNLFDKFYRVSAEDHETVEGTGLGLSIVDAIVKHHNGHVVVESKRHQGTLFTITLPRKNAVSRDMALSH